LRFLWPSLEGRRAVRIADQSEPKKPAFCRPTAVVDEAVRKTGAGTKIWHFSHILKGAKIGERHTLGRNCDVAENVIVATTSMLDYITDARAHESSAVK